MVGRVQKPKLRRCTWPQRKLKMVVEMCCQCVASTEIHDLNRSHGTRGLEYVGMQWFVDECVRARSMSTVCQLLADCFSYAGVGKRHELQPGVPSVVRGRMAME